MAVYDGDAFKYLADSKAEQAGKLKEIFEGAVRKSQDADRQIEAIRNEFAGTVEQNLNAQQALDKGFSDHMIGLQGELDVQEAETLAMYERASGAIQDLDTYELGVEVNGSDYDAAERMWGMS